MQFTFAPGATNYRLGGVSIYNDAIPNASEFTNLYDQWKLVDVVIRFDYTTNILSNSGVAYSPPLILFASDYDDPGDAAVTDLLQYPEMSTHCFNTNGYKPLILKLKPRPLRDVAGSGVATSYSPMEVIPFIRTSEFSTPHYGLKCALQSNGASVSAVIGYFQMTIWLDMEFTNPK